jgi:hypothetical protein
VNTSSLSIWSELTETDDWSLDLSGHDTAVTTKSSSLIISLLEGARSGEFSGEGSVWDMSSGPGASTAKAAARVSRARADRTIDIVIRSGELRFGRESAGNGGWTEQGFATPTRKVVCGSQREEAG